jgi:hypothetical protein
MLEAKRGDEGKARGLLFYFIFWFCSRYSGLALSRSHELKLPVLTDLVHILATPAILTEHLPLLTAPDTTLRIPRNIGACYLWLFKSIAVAGFIKS